MLNTDRFLPELPLNAKLSLFYNESSNFQPGNARTDILGRPIEPPKGDVKDYGFQITALNGKLNFKANFFKNTVANAHYGDMNHVYLGMAESMLFATAMRDYATLMDLPGYDDPGRDYSSHPYQAWTDDEGIVRGDPAWLDYLEKNGMEIRNQTPEEALQWQERAVNAAIGNFALQEFWDAWGMTMSEERWQKGWMFPWWGEVGAGPPDGYSLTVDQVSQGEEYELNFKPTQNWDIVMNATRVGASRDNIAKTIVDWVEQRNPIHNGDAGDLRLWWWGDRDNTLKGWWNGAFYTWYRFFKNREGLDASELREWRFNIVSNYRIQEGKFKGLNFGGAFRWEDEITIGYPMFATTTDEGSKVADFEIDNPYLGPEENHLDLWIGYERDLGERLSWKIQLNARDILAKGELIPVSVDPDGQGGQTRLEGDPTWFVSNKFTF